VADDKFNETSAFAILCDDVISRSFQNEMAAIALERQIYESVNTGFFSLLTNAFMPVF